MQSKIILFVFLFINLYFPISPYLIMGIDILFLLLYGKKCRISFYGPFIVIPSILLIIATLGYLTAYNTDGESFIVFKYLRTLISAIIVIVISSNIKVTPKWFVRCLGAVLVLHMLAIIAQTIYPPLSTIMAPYFNFTRDQDFLENMNVRKLGLTCGYDLASMLLVSSIILFCQQFMNKGKLLYFLLAITAFALTLTVSRFGMVIGAMVVAYYAISFFGKKGVVRVTGIALSIVFAAVAGLFILPILASTNGLLFNYDISTAVDISYFLQDYSSASGTLYDLTDLNSEHLNVFRKLDFLQFLLGAGNSSNSDIGYMQLLFQVGLIGILLLFIFYYIIFVRIKRVRPDDPYLKLLRLFLLTYIVCLFVFNYKIQILYSRGFHELMIICYVYLINWNKLSLRNNSLLYDENTNSMRKL